MKVHVNEAPAFVEELQSPFLVEVDQKDQLQGLSPIISYESPLITDLEQDNIELKITVPEILKEAASFVQLEDHFICSIDTELINIGLVGTHEILIDMQDDGLAPKFLSTVTWTLQVSFNEASHDDLSPEEMEKLQ